MTLNRSTAHTLMAAQDDLPSNQKELTDMTYDLETHDGLKIALGKAGSWAELERSTGVPASTLKSRGDRLGIRRAEVLDWQEPEQDADAAVDDWEEEMNRPILSERDFEAIEAFVKRNVHYLLHEAPARIEAAMKDGDCTPEMAEAILCASVSKRLAELVYSTHGVTRQMLWWWEREQKRREREKAA